MPENEQCDTGIIETCDTVSNAADLTEVEAAVGVV